MSEYFSGPFLPTKDYFTGFSSLQIIVILGIALFGVATFITSYDAINGTNKRLYGYQLSSEFIKANRTKFIVILVLAIVAIVMGLFLSWLFRQKQHNHRMITFTLTLAGLIALIYAIWIRFVNNQATGITLAVVCGTIFFAFLVLGFIANKGATVGFTKPTNLFGETKV